ncbi:MAG: UDP-N-acetylglucosamine 1-carboxyvinyltransferase [Clostridiales bacterium]|jgi:UDP-N-acetylglucosamine 1-carboxyvinyltransferase|nr:UDP-N-acetylglucosamine 1-carboxyvinyltransferase [Clostridiales bacterium]
MGEYHIRGMNPLRGKISPGGSKNAVLPILAAAVLNGGKSVIFGCPDISDTHIALKILRALGCKADFNDGVITVDSEDLKCTTVPQEYIKKMRSSIIFMGSLLGRAGAAVVSHPGGCDLGERAIDYHIKALLKMGAVIREDAGILHCRADGLTGQHIIFDTPSVGATENVMLAAVLAKGETVVTNAAREPEIVDLQNFLLGMGAKVAGAGTERIVINGVTKLRDTQHTVIPDRIVAGTFLTAAAITGGEITLTNVVPEHIYPIYTRLAEAGCTVKEEEDRIHLRAPKRLVSIDSLTTLPHPGFPTDMHQPFTSMLSIAKGSCIIKETLFDARNKHIPELRRMGAEILTLSSCSSYIVRGVKTLSGATVEAKDLRGGAALILAGLAAHGKTVVKESHHIERGYERIEQSLASLGADIELKPSESEEITQPS